MVLAVSVVFCTTASEFAFVVVLTVTVLLVAVFIVVVINVTALLIDVIIKKVVVETDFVLSLGWLSVELKLSAVKSTIF